jgi:hypothetical protein
VLVAIAGDDEPTEGFDAHPKSSTVKGMRVARQDRRKRSFTTASSSSTPVETQSQAAWGGCAAATNDQKLPHP